MKMSSLLAEGRKRLLEADITDASVDAWELLEYVFGIDKNYYYMHMEESVPESQVRQYEELIQKRTEHTPLQHLTGYAHFMGLKFAVNEHVLIPRFDTEILVEQTLKFMQGNEHILDLCTGSGCILLSLLHEQKNATGVGADISEKALQMARQNAGELGILADFVQSDLFSHIQEKYDIIVSNPPYIGTEVIQTLDAEVKNHEPLLALDGMADGLHFYRKIIEEAGGHLNDGGHLCFEIGFDQGEAVSALMRDKGYENVQVIRDLSGLDRVVTGGKTCLTN